MPVYYGKALGKRLYESNNGYDIAIHLEILCLQNIGLDSTKNVCALFMKSEKNVESFLTKGVR